MKLSVEGIEMAIRNLSELRNANIITENTAVATLVVEATHDATILLTALNDLMRNEITLDLIFEKIVSTED